MTKRIIPFMTASCILISFIFTGCSRAGTSSTSDVNSEFTSDTFVSLDVPSDTTSDTTSDNTLDTASADSGSETSAQGVSQSSSNQTPASEPVQSTDSTPNTDQSSQNTPSDADSNRQKIRVYAHNVCSHGDRSPGGGGEIGQNPQRLPGICSVISENAPNVVVLTECNSLWAKSVAKKCGYEIAENQRTGLSEIQILYNAGEFNLIENSVDDSDRSAYHWVILESKKTSQRFIVYGYHGTILGSNSEMARKNEINNAIALVQQKNLPTIFTGDFNTTRESEEYALTETLFANAALTAQSRYDGSTHLGWNSASSGIIIDHLLYSKNKFTAKTFTVLDQYDSNGVILSDHCALFAELEMN